MKDEFINLRKSLGWGAAEAARQIGVSVATIQSAESGRREFKRPYLLAMRRLVEHPEDRLDVEGS